MKKLNIRVLKKFLNILIIYFQLILNRIKIGFKSLPEIISFIIIINPIFNKLFCIWFSNINRENKFNLKILKILLNNGIGFGAIRHITPENRTKFHDFVINTKPIKHKNLKDDISKIIDNLVEKGYAKLPIKLSPNELINIQDYFGKCNFYDSQVFAQSNNKEINLDWRNIKNFNSSKRNFCFRQIDTVNYLNKYPIINFKYLKHIADLYCGFNTSLYELNTFGTFPGNKNSYVMRHHRDFDDFKFLTFFVAWTKTSEEDGATLFAPGTHLSSRSSKKMIPLSAEAGEIFALDTFGIHAGNPKVLNPRLTSWIRFGNPINLATIQNGTANEIGLLKYD